MPRDKSKKRKDDSGPSREKTKKGKTKQAKFVLPEFIDKDALQALYELELSHFEEASVRFLFEKSQQPAQRMNVSYYEDGSFAHPSMLDLPDILRKFVTWRTYHLLQVELNVGVLLLRKLAETPSLQDDENMKPMFADLTRWANHPDDEQWQTTLRSVLKSNKTDEEDSLQLMQLQQLVQRWVDSNDDIARQYEEFKMDEDDSHDKTLQFLRHLISGSKAGILDEIYHKACSDKHTIGAICKRTNCVMVERTRRYTGDLLTTERKVPNEYGLFSEDAKARITRHVSQKFNVDIQIHELSLLNTPAELYEIDTYDLHLPKINNKYRQIYALLEQRAAKHHFKRQKGYVMRPHDTLPNVYVRHQTREEFVESVLIDHPTYKSGLEDKKIAAWFNDTNCRKFGILKENTRYIAFTNGRFDLDDVIFTPWSQVNDDINYTHFYDQIMDENAPTPLWDKLLQYQFNDREERESASPTKSKFTKQQLFEILVGRILFPNALHDRWEVVCFLEGDAGTGKSTLTQIVQSMFPAGSIGIISGCHESTFGFQSSYACRCLFVPDCSLQFHKKIDQTVFQNMITGDGVSCPVKNGLAVTVLAWKAHFFMAGNKIPQYVDQSGSVARRFFRFLFRKTIVDCEGDIRDKIIAHELATIIVRCVKTYRRVAHELGNRGFWDHVAGDDYAWMRNDTASKNNRLDQFLDGFCDETRVIKTEGLFTLKKVFVAAFSEYLKKCGDKPRSYIDASESKKFTDRGFVEQTYTYCSICGKRAIKGHCTCLKPIRVKWEGFEGMQLKHYNSQLQEIAPFGSSQSVAVATCEADQLLF